MASTSGRSRRPTSGCEIGNQPLLLLEDGTHSQSEPRFHALGKTDTGRILHITFTLRQSSALVRVISARDMHRKERAIYENAD